MSFLVTETNLADLLVIKPNVYEDQRGHFYESFNENKINSIIKQDIIFVQDNHSYSKKNVLRGMHYQINNPQGKLVRVIQGTIFDVAVDLRRSSPTYCHWYGIEISATNKLQLWIPPGFAHGFLVLSESADLLYKTTEYWHSDSEKILIWNDEIISIDWPLKYKPILSDKDKYGKKFTELNKEETFE